MKTNATKTITLHLTDDQRRIVRAALGADTRTLVIAVAACGRVKYGGPPIGTHPPQGALQLTQSQRREIYGMTGCTMDTLEFSRANLPRPSGGLLLLSLFAGYLTSEGDR
jgi:hypothetical protein